MSTDQKQLIHAELTDQVLGTFFAVYNELGNGFLESVYREAMALALKQAGLRIERERPVPVYFRGVAIGDFRADLLVEGAVLLELKVARTLDRVHEAQLLHYLKATEIEVGLLLNFGLKPEFRRLLLTNDQKKIRGNPCKSVVAGSSL